MFTISTRSSVFTEEDNASYAALFKSAMDTPYCDDNPKRDVLKLSKDTTELSASVFTF